MRTTLDIDPHVPLSPRRATFAPGNAIAVDVLLQPDEVMSEHMRTLNARLRESYPEGYALDERRIPHVTLVQRYVARDRLADALEAAAQILSGEPLPTRLLATGYHFSQGKSATTVSVNLASDAALSHIQAGLIEALAPFTTPDGDDSAFVRDADEPSIEPSTIEYVRDFVPARTSERYEPHITVGRASSEEAQRLEAEGYPPLQFNLAGAAVYQLGNAGTARRKLWPRQDCRP